MIRTMLSRASTAPAFRARAASTGVVCYIPPVPHAFVPHAVFTEYMGPHLGLVHFSEDGTKRCILLVRRTGVMMHARDRISTDKIGNFGRRDL